MVARIEHLAGDCGYFSTEEGEAYGVPHCLPSGHCDVSGDPPHSHQILKVQGRF